LAESYIKSFDLGLSLRLDRTFVSAKVGKTIVIRRTRQLPSKYWIHRRNIFSQK